MPSGILTRRRMVIVPAAGSIGPGTTYDSVVLAETSLTHFYKMNEAAGAGTASDSKGALSGTIGGLVTAGSIAIFPSEGSTSFLFAGSGSTSSITFSSLLSSLASNFSVEFFFKTADVTTQQFIFYNGDNSGSNNWGVYILNGNIQWHNFTNADKILATGVLSINTPYHVVVTYDGTNFKTYVNGVLSATVAGAVDTPSGTAWVGRTAGTTLRYTGRISKLALYNAVLTGTQVTNHYTAP